MIKLYFFPIKIITISNVEEVSIDTFALCLTEGLHSVHRESAVDCTSLNCIFVIVWASQVSQVLHFQC